MSEDASARSYSNQVQSYAQNASALKDKYSRLGEGVNASKLQKIFEINSGITGERRERAIAIASVATSVGLVPQGFREGAKALRNLKARRAGRKTERMGDTEDEEGEGAESASAPAEAPAEASPEASAPAEESESLDSQLGEVEPIESDVPARTMENMRSSGNPHTTVGADDEEPSLDDRLGEVDPIEPEVSATPEADRLLGGPSSSAPVEPEGLRGGTGDAFGEGYSREGIARTIGPPRPATINTTPDPVEGVTRPTGWGNTPRGVQASADTQPVAQSSADPPSSEPSASDPPSSEPSASRTSLTPAEEPSGDTPPALPEDPASGAVPLAEEVGDDALTIGTKAASIGSKIAGGFSAVSDFFGPIGIALGIFASVYELASVLGEKPLPTGKNVAVRSAGTGGRQSQTLAPSVNTASMQTSGAGAF